MDEISKHVVEIFASGPCVGSEILGLLDCDDAVCLPVDKSKLLFSADGPYAKRLVMLSALVHASTDILAKGGRVIFALDCLSGTENEIIEMAESLSVQSRELGIPVIGGNTNCPHDKGTLMRFSKGPCASIFVFGELLLPSPLKQSGGKLGDSLMLFGEPLWGDSRERMAKAKKLFSDWYALLADIKSGSLVINAAKDVTKGGIKETAREIAEASKLGFELFESPVHMTRNLDCFLISVDKKNASSLKALGERLGCPILEVGELV